MLWGNSRVAEGVDKLVASRNNKARTRRAKSLNSWCPEAESNHRHGDFQSPALPTELSGRVAVLLQRGAIKPV